MKPRFLSKGAGGGAPESGNPPPGSPPPLVGGADRACCCPAYPVAQAIMPAAPERPHPVDLLLCGHHYRVSRQALAAAGATVTYLPGKADAAEAALLDNRRRDSVLPAGR